MFGHLPGLLHINNEGFYDVVLEKRGGNCPPSPPWLRHCTSTADLTSDLSSALGKCFLSDSDGSISESDAECPICGLTFLEDDSDSP